MTSTHSLTITTDEADWIARGLLAAIIRNPSQTREHPHFRVVGGELVATAADGRRTHQIHLRLFSAPDDCAFTMPTDALRWMQRAAKQFKPDKDALVSPSVTIAVEVPDEGPNPLNPGELTITVREWDDPGAPSITYEARLIAGEYPPYWRTIDALFEATPGEPSRLPLGHLGAAANLHVGETMTPVIRYTTNRDGSPGLALLLFWDGETLRAAAAITPKSEDHDA